MGVRSAEWPLPGRFLADEGSMTDRPAPYKRGGLAWWGRPWWQLAAGVGLIAATLAYYFSRSTPQWSPGGLDVPFTPVRLAGGLTEAAVLPAAPGSLAGCNVLLVTLDTTRVDRIGCYGNDRIETPNLDRLAADGVVFSEALATAPSTLPSHASILTGLYPYHHGARANGAFHLDDVHETLAEVLAGHGYATGAVISAFVLDARFGLAQGFQLYDDDLGGGPQTAALMYAERRADRTTDRAIRRLGGAGERPFLLWVHYFDPHATYQPPSPYAEKYGENRYDGEIAFVDQELGRLLGMLDELGLTGRTLVVVVADHGEGLRSHGEQTHGYLAYNPTVQIPLIMRCAGRLDGGVHIRRRVTQVDLMPTVLSLLGVESPVGLDGVDLTASSGVDRAVFIENLQGLMEYGWAPQAVVCQGAYKYIHGAQRELYDVFKDPVEARDLYSFRTDVAGRLKARLADLFGSDLDAALSPAPTRTVSPDESARLESLGYIVGGAGEACSIDSQPDPMVMLPILDRVAEVVNVYSGANNVDEAIRQLEDIARDQPGFLPAFKYLGHFYRRAGRLAEAERALRQCLRIRPDVAVLHLALAETLEAKGDTQGAVELYRRIIARHPRHYGARYRLGRALLREGKPEAAADHLEAAFRVNPGDRGCLVQMVRAFVASDRSDEARVVLSHLLEKNPRLPRVRAVLADLLGRQERYTEAETLLRRGVELMPDDPEAVGALARFLVQCPVEGIRQPAEGVSMMERVCRRTGYRDPLALYGLSLVYTMVGRADEGISVAGRAQAIATEAGKEELAKAITALLDRQTRASEPEAPP